MATPFELLSLDELQDLLVAGYQNRFPDHDVSRLSDNWKRLRVLAMACTDLQSNTNQKAKNLQPGTAKSHALDVLLGIYGLTRTAATVARGTAAGRVQGTSGSTFAVTDILEHANGETYRPNAAGTVPAALFVDIDIVSVSTGSAVKLDAGETLTWQTTPTGLENDVELQVGVLQGGADIESDGSAQVRLLARIAQPAAGGNANDYKTWITEATDSDGDELGIIYPYVWPNRDGLLSVDVAGLFDGTGSARIMTSAQETSLSTYIEARRPVGPGTIRVLTVSAESQDLDITVEPKAGDEFAKDWDDSAGFTVAAWTAATRTLQLSAARPADLAVGDRIIVAGHTGDQLVVEELGAGADEVIVKSKTEADVDIYTPVAAETVYAGGSLVEPCRVALQVYIDTLGPRTGDFSDGSWVSTWYVHRLRGVVDDVAGVLKPTMVTPSADKEPTAKPYPNLDTVNLLVTGEVLVRYA